MSPHRKGAGLTRGGCGSRPVIGRREPLKAAVGRQQDSLTQKTLEGNLPDNHEWMSVL